MSTPEPSKTYQLPDKSPVLTSFSPKLNGVVFDFVSVASSPEANPVTTSTQVFDDLEPPRETPEVLNNSPLEEVSSVETHHKSPSSIPEATIPVVIPPKSSTSTPATTSTKTSEDSRPLRDIPKTSDSTLDEVITPRKLPPRVMKGATHSITLSDLFVKATSSVSGFSHMDDSQVVVESPEVGNKTLNGIVAPQKAVRRLSSSRLTDSDELLGMNEATRPQRECVCI